MSHPDSGDGARSQRDKFVSRRRFLRATGATVGATVLAGCSSHGHQGGTPTETPPPGTSATTETEPSTPAEPDESALAEKYPGLEILERDVENAQAATRATYTDVITPREEHYIRNHYPTPAIDAAEWTVSLTGLVDDEIDLSMDEIKHSYRTESVAHTMQCSGNGRAYFDPQVDGHQWSFGAVGTTVWTGTPVRPILEQHGADTSTGTYLSVMGGDAPEGEDIFCRSIPMQKVLKDTLLAYEMNGSPMTADHGFPVRLIVPGWYGNNSVKWVTQMHVMETMVVGEEWEDDDQPRYTHWQQDAYRIIPAQDDGATHCADIPVYDTREQMERPDEIRNAFMYDQLVKSLIGFPQEGQAVRPNPAGQIEVLGVAWAGDDGVETVEVSTDGGDTFGEAEFFGPALGPAAWRQFRYIWDAEPGEYTLVSKATDTCGRSQPATLSAPEEGLRGIRDDTYPWNQKGYGNTAYMPHAVECTVASR